jgi:hypothetical protein
MLTSSTSRIAVFLRRKQPLLFLQLMIYPPFRQMKSSTSSFSSLSQELSSSEVLRFNLPEYPAFKKMTITETMNSIENQLMGALVARALRTCICDESTSLIVAPNGEITHDKKPWSLIPLLIQVHRTSGSGLYAEPSP